MSADPIKRYHRFVPEIKLGSVAVRAAKIANDPEYGCHRLQVARSALFHDANRHSVLLEPDQKNTRDLTGLLSEAWEFGTSNYDDGNITQEYLLDLVAHLDGTHLMQSYCEIRRNDFRTGDVRMSGHNDVHPPGGPNVGPEMYDLIEYLNMEEFNPAIRAFNAHLHICRIHPFYDGNGRTSRMLMNIMLYKNGLPTVCIPSSEKETYRGLLRGAMRDYERRNEHEPHYEMEDTLMHFQIDKMAKSLESLDENLRTHRQHVVKTSGFEKGQLISAKKQIASIMRRHDSGTVRMKDGIFTVHGDIGQKHLKPIFEGVCGKKGKYDISSE